MKSRIELIIIKLIVKSPLKPSIKFAPFTINKKQRTINNVEKNLFCIQKFKKIKSILKIFIGSKLISTTKKIIISINLFLDLYFFISSRNPTKNKHEHINMYSNKIVE